MMPALTFFSIDPDAHPDWLGLTELFFGYAFSPFLSSSVFRVLRVVVWPVWARG